MDTREAERLAHRRSRAWTGVDVHEVMARAVREGAAR